MDKIAKADAVPVLPTAAVQAVLPDFRVDFQVQEQGPRLLSGQKWVWRQFAIKGQQLIVSDMVSKPLLTFQVTAQVALEPQSGHLYLLQDNGKTMPTLSCPSATRLSKFQSVLRLAASTPYWVLPPHESILQDLIDVATVIVETDKALGPDTSVKPKLPLASDVAAYLARIKPTYDHVVTLTSQTDLLMYLAQLEAEYCTSRAAATRATVRNFAHVVHQHNASDYDRANKSDGTWTTAKDNYAACPSCCAPLADDIAFRVRVAGITLECASCHATISQETIRIGGFYRDHTSFTVHGNSVDMPLVPQHATYASYTKLVAEAIKPFGKSDRKLITDTLVAYFQRLDLVAAMARHLVFVSLICSNFTYWSHPRVVEASLIRYRQFRPLALQDTAKPLMPTIDIALVRYVHQTLVSLPFFTLPATHSDLTYAETFLLWAETFQCPYSSFAPSYDAFMKDKGNPMKQPFRKKKWEKFHAVPSRDCRFVGVDESYALPMAVAVAVPTAEDTSGAVAAPPMAAEYVAVIGTPLMDHRVQPPREAKVFKGRHDTLYYAMSDPMTMYAAVEIGSSIAYLLINLLSFLC
ncbi:Aste57867_9493 [Aphanomyces stellatus]|uniref:Aste57867_9493 protein n=1 Tax=Aphanomyces stellatus TaxID=120398 RepID=A0A485KN50_9STRA|nr:hypothetical protein As57867_009456 [Aphanomyces stellatus]VFT86372.1 Aste57867_9493 [Aphanomyces stellatus]